MYYLVGLHVIEMIFLNAKCFYGCLGGALSLLGKVQLELQKLVDSYVSNYHRANISFNIYYFIKKFILTFFYFPAVPNYHDNYKPIGVSP